MTSPLLWCGCGIGFECNKEHERIRSHNFQNCHNGWKLNSFVLPKSQEKGKPKHSKRKDTRTGIGTNEPIAAWETRSNQELYRWGDVINDVMLRWPQMMLKWPVVFFRISFPTFRAFWLVASFRSRRHKLYFSAEQRGRAGGNERYPMETWRDTS